MRPEDPEPPVQVVDTRPTYNSREHGQDMLVLLYEVSVQHDFY